MPNLYLNLEARLAAESTDMDKFQLNVNGQPYESLQHLETEMSDEIAGRSWAHESANTEISCMSMFLCNEKDMFDRLEFFKFSHEACRERLELRLDGQDVK